MRYINDLKNAAEGYFASLHTNIRGQSRTKKPWNVYGSAFMDALVEVRRLYGERMPPTNGFTKLDWQLPYRTARIIEP